MMPTIEIGDLSFQESEPIVESKESHKIKIESSIPVQLCDEKLIEEIRSIPDKMGFKIGEVADLLDVKQYVLRYWETEFDLLRPKKATNNQRFYTKVDVENAFLIRKLLHRDRFSLEGAKMALRELKTHVRKEVQKEKSLSTMAHKIETVHDRVEALIMDLQKFKKLFK